MCRERSLLTTITRGLFFAETIVAAADHILAYLKSLDKPSLGFQGIHLRVEKDWGGFMETAPPNMQKVAELIADTS